MSSAALHQLVRTANGGGGAAAALRSLASLSSSLASASTTTTSTRSVMTVSSTSTRRSSPYDRSLPFAAATSARNMMMYANTSSSNSSGSSSILDSILDPSAPASLFESSSSGEKESEEPVVLRSHKFLKCGISENALRFKTQSYGRLLQAPFVHANEHRVTMLVRLDALPFTHQLEHDILQEIVGKQRYNVERHELRLQSVQFASRIENKRHLVSMLDRLVLSCQSLAKQVMEEEQESHEMKEAV